jgi:hypothetical protein
MNHRFFKSPPPRIRQPATGKIREMAAVQRLLPVSNDGIPEVPLTASLKTDVNFTVPHKLSFGSTLYRQSFNPQELNYQ